MTYRPTFLIGSGLAALGLTTALAAAQPSSAAGPEVRPEVARSAATAAAAPPKVQVLTNSGGLAPGYTFIAPKAFSNPVTTPSGPEIIDGFGRPVWWHQVTPGLSATDFRVQTYRGKPVLTWNEGQSSGGPGHSAGTDYIADTHYRIIATVNAGNGLSADQHEFQLTPQGTALITTYHVVSADLSSVGGPRNGKVFDCDVQEIDVRTGRVVSQWDAIKHVPFADSYQPLPADPTTTPWDYFHVNAVHLDTDGNLLINGRHTWTVYKVDRDSGKVIWRLGGKRSSFALGAGVRFAWQHDIEAVRPGVVRLFDNESNGTPVRAQSRIITIKVDTAHRTATLLTSLTHPDRLSAGSQGNAQLLPDGHVMVGWGQLGRVSEFDGDGKLLFDAQVPAGDDDYRAYRDVWTGMPLTSPTAAIRSVGQESIVHAIWNGATRVRSWQVYGGPDAQNLAPIAAAPWDGLNTAISVAGFPAVVKVVALTGSGRVLGTSALATAS